jgi:DNA invertase Pin-like site-specific DNA recombinase
LDIVHVAGHGLLVVSELSRLGRSLGQVIQIVDELVKRKVRFIAIKEAIRFEGKQDMQTKVMIALFGLFAEVERDLISQRTKEGLAAARAKGRLLGRPKGALGKSKLDGKEGEIRMLLEKTVSKASIAKIVGVSRTALHHFIRTRKLNAKASKGETRGHRP